MRIIPLMLVSVGAFFAWRVSRQSGNLTQRMQQASDEIVSKVGALIPKPAGARAPIPGSIPAHFRIDRLLDLIGRAEANNGYDSYYTGSRIQPPTRISQMTIQAVRNWQIQNVNAGSRSSAVGRYQFIGDTLAGLIAQSLVNPLTTLFGPQIQDAFATRLLAGRGLAGFLAGRVGAESFAASLAEEWAGLPRGPDGLSYYAGVAGNRARVTWAEVLRVLRGS